MNTKVQNPFTPNFGQQPLHLAGRDQVIAEILQSLESNPGHPARTSILVGPRGSGKTALLTYFAQECHTRGWISVNVNCVPGLQEDILQQAMIAGSEFLPNASGKQLTGVSVGNLFGVTWEKEHGMEMNWRTKISKVLDALAKEDIGLFITIDEVSPRLEELIQVTSVYQLLLRENRKIGLLMAGLPSQVSSLLSDQSISFLRRASRYDLKTISDHEIQIAFQKTIEDSGKKVTDAALSEAVVAIAGFPYMMQLVGYRSWQQVESRKLIRHEDVKQGISWAQKDFETRVLIATLKDLSAGDVALLKTMIPDKTQGYSSVSDLATRMKKSSGYISRYRDRLLEAGVIEAVGRGKIHCSIPGLIEYISRQ